MKVARVSLATAGLLLGLFLGGCREHNPAYLQLASPPDASMSKDASGSPDGPARDTRTGDVGAFLRDGSRGDGADSNAGSRDAGRQTLEAGGVLDSSAGGTGDTQALRDGGEGGSAAKLDGAFDVDVSPDGARDAPASLDGATAEPSEAGVVIVLDASAVDELDTDSSSPCQDGEMRSCVSLANPLVGACHAGTQTCAAGIWGPCSEVLPVAEICNGIDDNCNGMTDEGCTADCVVVSPTGDDSTADGTSANPFATLQAAIDFAAQPDGGVARRLCVSGGATCADSFTYTVSAGLTMANGVLAHGNYAFADAGLIYCGGSGPTTAIQFATSPLGVVFDPSITTHTELGGFAIQRFSPPNGSATAGPVSAVQVAGGQNITLSAIFVTDAPVADTTYGVDVGGGGQVTIIGSSIGGGQGRVTAVGVHVDGGRVVLRNNCDGNPQGICQSDCGAVGGSLGIRGRRGVTTAADPSANSSAVVVTNSSASPSTIVANTLCGGAGVTSNAGRTANVVAVQCDPGSCAGVAGNNITGGRGAQVVGLRVSGAGALVDSNLVNGGCGTDATTGLVLDDSSARVQNNRIFGGQCIAANPSSTFAGLSILLGPSSAEPDVNSNDIDPMAGMGSCQSTGVTIDRAAGDNVPAGILRNNIILAGACATGFGVVESATATARLVENNDLHAQILAVPSDTAAVLYRRAATDALTAAQVNLLAGAEKNISSDPKFVTYPIDLHLTAASPCIDRGTATGAPATDGDGQPRPSGNGFDIGAYEFPSP